jgi:lysophospholipase L1-like esterase
VFAGDSIIAGWTNLPSFFPGCKVANRGLGGDRTPDLLRRLDADVLALRPSGMVLLIGTNDLKQGADPESVLANLKAIVAVTHNRFPQLRILLCKLTPRELERGLFPDKIVALNRSLENAFLSDSRIILFDTWTLFANDRGGPKLEEFPDQLHPSAQAYTKWAVALGPVLKQMISQEPAAKTKEPPSKP